MENDHTITSQQQSMANRTNTIGTPMSQIMGPASQQSLSEMPFEVSQVNEKINLEHLSSTASHDMQVQPHPTYWYPPSTSDISQPQDFPKNTRLLLVIACSDV